MMQLQIKLKDNNQMLNERRANLKRLEPEMYSLRVNINELEAFEYPQEVEVSLMVCTEKIISFIFLIRI